jgi:hypothetical protein
MKNPDVVRKALKPVARPAMMAAGAGAALVGMAAVVLAVRKLRK